MKYILIILSSIIFLNIYSQNFYSEYIYMYKEKMQHDLSQWTNELKTNHINLYKYIQKDIFDSICNNAYNNLPDSLSLIDFYRYLSLINEKIKCGHTSLLLSDSIFFESKIFMPLKIKINTNNVCIAQDLQINKNRELENLILLEIDHIDIDFIIKKIKSHQNSEGLIEIGKTNYCERLFPLLYALYINTNAMHNIKVMNSSDSIFNIDIDSETFKTLIEIRKLRYPHISDNINLGLKNFDNLFYLNIPYFGIDNKRFISQTDSIFKIINNSSINKLIIDVRNNPGGEIWNVYYLLSYLTNKKIRSNYRFSYIKNHKIVNQKYYLNNYYKIKPQVNRFKGSVCVVSNGGSLSSTGMFLNLIKYYELGRIYGEESGVTGNGCNAAYDKDRLTLKYSKFVCIIPSGNYSFVKFNGSIYGRGIMPNVITHNYSCDINDDAIIKLIINDVLK